MTTETSDQTTATSARPKSPFDNARHDAQQLRRAYDGLDVGPKSILRRAATADEVMAEGYFWRLVDAVDVERGEARWLAQLVALFRFAPHRDRKDFDLGAHLRSRVFREVSADDLPRRAVAFRRLLAVRDRDDLVHQLGRVLVRAGQPRDGGDAIDWGVLGGDVKFFGDGVRRRWAAGFYLSRRTTDDAQTLQGDR